MQTMFYKKRNAALNLRTCLRDLMTKDKIKELVAIFPDSSPINYATSYTPEDTLKLDTIINNNNYTYTLLPL